ncbi:C-factor [BD1-7 clade bacterium]|uniref:C-factor n=1 Tax=BD1-7 clade bacterium TaxID=2029982 RepID=A0A5S9N0Z3_9GAMM|nr:C-factor [BD1-7 clade bacterium]CAA0083290.1 C-factor [BD1-7 clade bacterium]
MDRTIVITGANRGIGLAFVDYYLAQDDEVIAVCRKASADLKATTARIIEHIDVTSHADLNALKKSLAGQHIDILINNAGVLSNETLDDFDIAGIEKQFITNALAPLAVVETLQNNLQQGSKVAMITSRMGSIEDNGSGGYYGYRMSKAALNAAGKSLAIDLKPRGISVTLLHPGLVSTRMIGFAGDVAPEGAVEGLTQRIEALNPDNTGTFWHANGDVLPW